MKLLAVSDKTVDYLYASNVRQQLPDIDLLVGCGDLPWYYLDFLFSAMDVPLVYVKGNHDADPQHLSDGRVLESVDGGIDLHGKVKMVKGLLVAGIEGSMRYRPSAPLMYTERAMRWQLFLLGLRLTLAQQRYRKRLDLLVTHSPPFGIHDEEDRPHIGFKVFLPFMRHFKPRYLLHGHVHRIGPDVVSQTQYFNTTVINVFPYKQITLAGS